MAVTRTTRFGKRRRYVKPTLYRKRFAGASRNSLTPSYGPGMYSLRTAARTYRSKRAFSALRASSRLTPFPRTKLVKHNYCDQINLPAGASAGFPVTWKFRANSTYDPDLTGTGHQPMFRDEMADKYQYYTVLSSTIEIIFPPSEEYRKVLALWLDDDGAAPTTLVSLQEQRRTIDAIRLDKRQTPLKLKCFYDAAKWNKTTVKGILADDQQKIAAGSNPGTTAKTWILQVWPLLSSQTLPIDTVQVNITYTVLWREPNEFVTS